MRDLWVVVMVVVLTASGVVFMATAMGPPGMSRVTEFAERF